MFKILSCIFGGCEFKSQKLNERKTNHYWNDKSENPHKAVYTYEQLCIKCNKYKVFRKVHKY